MERSEKTRQVLIAHYQAYPQIQIQDIFKFIYQSAFGCEHLVKSLQLALDYIREEYEKGVSESVIEELDGEYCRVPLSYINKGLSIETLGKLFYLSAEKEENGFLDLISKIEIAKNLVQEKLLPFNISDFEKQVNAWKEKGYPPIHHSESFRKNYKPAYRLVAKQYVPFLPLFAEIDKRLKKGAFKIAIEGGSGSGKSTLARTISNIYKCTTLHMDDFFLQPYQRTPERFKEAGGNVDRERFYSEVVKPLKNKENINYRPFDCATMTIGEGKVITPEKLTVIEGVYSMHPDLSDYYDFSVFLDISSEQQIQRIKKRNTPQLAKLFFTEWIPLEEKYFSTFNIKEKCDMIISVK